jgi:photoactive yellow protein
MNNLVMNTIDPISLEHPELLAHLETLNAEGLDQLPFGVIGFDAAGNVVRYNAYESQAALFPVDTVMGQHVFIELAPCLNNYLVAGRFEEAATAGTALDETMPYVLTFRMRPTRVRMRILFDPAVGTRYLCILRTAGAAA